MTVLKMPLHNLPSRPSQRVDVKDVPGRFVKHVMGLNKSAKGGAVAPGIDPATSWKAACADNYLTSA
jgi:hypothetical protein